MQRGSGAASGSRLQKQTAKYVSLIDMRQSVIKRKSECRIWSFADIHVRGVMNNCVDVNAKCMGRMGKMKHTKRKGE